MIVVTGASGNVGRHLVQQLIVRGHHVRAVARGVTGPLPSEPGVTPVVADLLDAEGFATVFDGAKALLLLLPGAGGGVDVARLLDLAAAGGVSRVVLLSSQAVGTRPTAPSHAPMAAIEGLVRASTLAWTVLRPGGFHTNSLAWAQTVRDHRTVYTPFADVALPSVDPADIAAVAAEALTGDAHDGRTYVLTGPAAITPRERVRALERALGQAVDLVELTRAQAREHMLAGMPPEVADGTLDIIGQPTREEANVSPDVAMVLGRPATSYETWLSQHTELFS